MQQTSIGIYINKYRYLKYNHNHSVRTKLRTCSA